MRDAQYIFANLLKVSSLKLGTVSCSPLGPIANPGPGTEWELYKYLLNEYVCECQTDPELPSLNPSQIIPLY